MWKWIELAEPGTFQIVGFCDDGDENLVSVITRDFFIM
jgi:hypothetical protein